jgi:hypothetical protein
MFCTVRLASQPWERLSGNSQILEESRIGNVESAAQREGKASSA